MAFLYWLLPLVFLCSLIGTWMLRHYAVSRSILDVPNARSSHEVPTPRGGGVAVVVTVAMALVETVEVATAVIDLGVKNAILGLRGGCRYAPEGIRRGVGCAASPRAEAVGRRTLAQRGRTPRGLRAELRDALARSAGAGRGEGL